MIDFGAQVSGGESDKAISPFHIKLLELFYDPPELNGYFVTLKEFQIVFRVSGEGNDFDGDGPEFLKVSKKRKVISVDLTVPESKWKGRTKDEFKDYISTNVKKCFTLLLAKALELNEVVDQEKLIHDFSSSIQEFDSWAF